MCYAYGIQRNDNSYTLSGGHTMSSRVLTILGKCSAVYVVFCVAFIVARVIYVNL